MNKNYKKSLYESIMNTVAKSVKKILNESLETPEDNKVTIVNDKTFQRLLFNNVIIMLYKKKDGSTKLTCGTVNPKYLELLNASEAPRKFNSTIQYYDIIVRDWRSISISSSMNQQLGIAQVSSSAKYSVNYLNNNSNELISEYELIISTLENSQKRKTKKYCAYCTYEEITDLDVSDFWKKMHQEGIISYNDTRDEWKPARKIAMKNVAMLDAAFLPSYSVFYDKKGNLYIHVNTGASWSLQNHLRHYADKCKKYFTLQTCAWGLINDEFYEKLYDGRK